MRLRAFGQGLYLACVQEIYRKVQWKEINEGRRTCTLGQGCFQNSFSTRIKLSHLKSLSWTDSTVLALAGSSLAQKS